MSYASLPPRSCCHAIHFPSGDHAAPNWRSSETASCTGHPPVDDTFQTFRRPVRFVEKAISFPSGDHDGSIVFRLTKRSSIGTGRALTLRGEVTVAGSVIARSSGERAK